MTNSGSNKFRLLFFLLSLVFISGGYARTPDFTLTQPDSWKPAFSSTFEKGLYKTRLEIGKHKLSGMMFMKRTSDSTFRVVFANEIGMTFFDIEISAVSATVHAIFPSMDKPALLKTLEQDLRLMLIRDPFITKIMPCKIKDESKRTYKTKSSWGKATYFVEQDSQRLYRHKSARSMINRTEIRYTYGDPKIPVSIYLVNPTIRIHLYMNLLNN